ncbi:MULTISPECIES: metallophosphoesterase [unclassified Luteococcus]|uniref:metallophosphoesterase n=1 Tax=unclassified Luteococcus TaxID=2639923 RepID=UPI00313C1E8A
MRRAPRPKPSGLRRVLRWSLRLLITGLVLVALLAGLSWYEVTHTKLARLELTSAKITGRPLKVMQITDLHDLEYTSQRDDLIEMVAEQQPDLIALTGDFVNTETRDFGRLDVWFGKLAALGIPMYAVPGNHDHWQGNLPGLEKMLESHGVQILADRHVSLDGEWGRLDLIGTDDYYTRRGNLAKAIAGARPDAYQLVLTHAPEIHKVLATSTADLAICGHTHGGQIRLPWAGAIVAPGQPYFPEWDKGLYDVGRSWLYIDSGVGQTVPVRLLDQSQITLITVAPPGQ